MVRPFVPSRAEKAGSNAHAPLAPPLRAKPAGEAARRTEPTDSSAEELPWLTGSALPMEAPTPAADDDLELVDELYSGAREVDLSDDQQTDWGTPADLDEPADVWSAGPTEEQPEDEDLFDNLVRETDVGGRSEEEGLMDEPPEFLPTTGADSQRVEEIAMRLERIARSLREGGAAGPLTGQGTDPLGALITGYILGVSESAGRHGEPPED